LLWVLCLVLKAAVMICRCKEDHIAHHIKEAFFLGVASVHENSCDHLLVHARQHCAPRQDKQF
jgi:hypothetical protein